MTSDEDVIRRMYDAVAKGDLDSFAERLHPEVVWEHNIGGGSLEEGTYRGPESVRRLMERIIEPWEYMRVEPEDIKHVWFGLDDEGRLYFRTGANVAKIRRTSKNPRVLVAPGADEAYVEVTPVSTAA